MPESDPIVFIVDDDASIRRGLERLFRSVGLEVESFALAREFLERKPPDRPSCLVLDVRMPGLSGLDLQRELSRKDLRIPIIFITGHGDVPMSVRAMKDGAVDFLPKPVNDQDLLDSVQRAVERNRNTRRKRAELARIQARIDTLTPRERQVLALVVSGRLNKQAARELGVSEKTVKVHRARVMEKMQAVSLADLVRMADRAGIGAAPGG